MKNYSIWKENIDLGSYDKLKENLDVDVLIIGGGMTGINTMYQLRDSSLEVVLVEQNKLGMGVTANSTGKLTFLQDNLYEKIWKSFDKNTASMYLKSQIDAIEIVLGIIESDGISCDLIKAPSFVYASSDDEVLRLNELKEFLEASGINVIDGNSELVSYRKMIGVENTYLFHPLRYIKGLIDKIDKSKIYENTSIVRMDNSGDDGYICYTNDDKIIRAGEVVIASHYPYFNLPFMFPIKGSLEKSYLSASRYKEDNISLIKYDKPVVSIRSYLDYLIYLGNSHSNNSEVDDNKHFKELEKKLSDLGLKPEFMWSNIDVMTNDGLPYIGKIDDRLLLATGYNTWGMTNGILAGKIISDIIKGNKNTYRDLFAPKRINLASIEGMIVDGLKSIGGIVNGILTDSNLVKYEVVEGKEVAIYKDDKGEHKVYTKCPHMGCRLVFNEKEKTWDCPCHSSRFDVDGKCINGPSNRDIKVKKELEK